MAPEASPGSSRINRRKLLAGIGTVAATGLAGCGDGDGGDGGDGGDLGERVGTVVVGYQTGRGTFTAVQEAARGPIEEGVRSLGVNFEYRGLEFAPSISNITGDTREVTYQFIPWSNAPSRLDPDFDLRVFTIQWAGGNGNLNLSNYASCEYSEPANAQASAGSEQEREDLVHQAQQVANEDFAALPLVANTVFNAVRTDEIDVQRTGEAGFQQINPLPWVYSEPLNGDGFVSSVLPVTVDQPNFMTTGSSTGIAVWVHLVHSPLVEYDENFELTNVLAEDYEVTNEAQTITATLADATFHNGDPVTAEDVKFTFELLSNNADSYPQANELPLESINAVDESTVEFNLTEPFLPLITRTWPKWGVLHKDTWEPAVDDPSGFTYPDKIGSGPFQVASFETGRQMELTPHDGHPIYEPNHSVTFISFRSSQSVQQAFQSNEIQVAPDVPPGIAENIEENMSDAAEINTLNGFHPYNIFPQIPQTPVKFREFRHAVGAAINRVAINDLAFQGKSYETLQSTLFLENHPWSHPDPVTYTDDPQGSVEEARQILEDAGFGWDGDGNLRYPSDADLSPLWPAGETPDPADFPCLQ